MSDKGEGSECVSRMSKEWNDGNELPYCYIRIFSFMTSNIPRFHAVLVAPDPSLQMNQAGVDDLEWIHPRNARASDSTLVHSPNTRTEASG